MSVGDDVGEDAAAEMTLLIGLTGPIGCGKSTIAAALAERGGVVIDADGLARGVTLPGSPALAAIEERFGDRVLASDGSLDRSALARIVFADPAALRDLEAIVHPAVRPLIEQAVARAEAEGAPFVVVEAIKLVEAGYADRCDEVWLVTCTAEMQRDRLAARGMADAEIARRMASQGADLVERLRPHATREIDAGGDLAVTVAQALEALDNALEGRKPGRSSP